MNAPFAVLAAMEIDVRAGRAFWRRRGLGKTRGLAATSRLRALALQLRSAGVAFDARFVGQHLVQVDHQARAIAGLHDIGASQVAFAEFLHGFAEPVRVLGKSNAMRGGSLMVKPAGRAASAFFSPTLSTMPPAAHASTLSACMLFGIRMCFARRPQPCKRPSTSYGKPDEHFYATLLKCLMLTPAHSTNCRLAHMLGPVARAILDLFLDLDFGFRSISMICPKFWPSNFRP